MMDWASDPVFLDDATGKIKHLDPCTYGLPFASTAGCSKRRSAPRSVSLFSIWSLDRCLRQVCRGPCYSLLHRLLTTVFWEQTVNHWLPRNVHGSGLPIAPSAPKRTSKDTKGWFGAFLGYLPQQAKKKEFGMSVSLC